MVVTGPGTTASASADLTTLGRITGTVTGGGTYRSGVIVYAYQLIGSAWVQKGSTSTAAGTGAYMLPLPAGTYRLYFSDPSKVLVPEYFNDAPTLTSAADVVVNSLTVFTADADLAVK